MSKTKTLDPTVLSATATAPEIVEALSVLLDADHEIGAAVTCNASRFVLARFIFRNADTRRAILMASNGLPLSTLEQDDAKDALAGMKRLSAHLHQLGPEAEDLFLKATEVLVKSR